jgi:DNA mismatch repair ATPase MutS
MAGMPALLVKRASSLLKELETKSISHSEHVEKAIIQQRSNYQLNIFDIQSAEFEAIREELALLDVAIMTPIECMLKLKEIIDKIKGD